MNNDEPPKVIPLRPGLRAFASRELADWKEHATDYMGLFETETERSDRLYEQTGMRAWGPELTALLRLLNACPYYHQTWASLQRRREMYYDTKQHRLVVRVEKAYAIAGVLMTLFSIGFLVLAANNAAAAAPTLKGQVLTGVAFGASLGMALFSHFFYLQPYIRAKRIQPYVNGLYESAKTSD
ncbi:hypothetical protein [Chitiniphilus eburneus]|uniref:hypothetical protein n=1 Tax=Chitiniphilus eburneus TaxID=2571148 RepID=UPI0035D0CC11